uniref:E3 ubiquitin-protein ligase COP1 n=1 Tax=Lygus hesperus TaxID=30085 RepID=A0A0A9VZY1_LYGHE
MKTTKGQVGALAHLLHDDDGHYVMYGDQGGVLTVVDTRNTQKVSAQVKLHAPCVLSGIRVLHGDGNCVKGEGPYVVTCGADKHIHVLDARQSYRIVHTLTGHTDYIYSM